MSELKRRRALFTRLVVLLLTKMIAEGYTPLIGRDGLKHMPNSLHFDGLAIDIDLFKPDGTYCDKTEDHKQFGDYWESLHELTFWGGNGIKEDGLKYDGNHYSITMGGRK